MKTVNYFGVDVDKERAINAGWFASVAQPVGVLDNVYFDNPNARWESERWEYEIRRPAQSLIYPVHRIEHVNQYTRIYYYSGAFGVFHEGHQDVVQQIIDMQQDDDYIVVISPSNCNYSAMKYGAHSKFASNKLRMEHIMNSDVFKNNDRVVIDTSPMLRYDDDINFDRQLSDFVKQLQQLKYVDNEYPINSYIVFGKDRETWNSIDTITNSKVKTVFIKGNTKASTSNDFVNEEIQKKHLILRCNSMEEFNLFESFFSDQYLSIKCHLISDELEIVKTFRSSLKLQYTNCKDYASILPYVKVSRKYVHPLVDPTELEYDKSFDFNDAVFIDSDQYTGFTSSKLESMGATVFTVMQSVDTNTTEILDFDDFKRDTMRYPYVDISSKCSMQAFTTEFHQHYENFLKAVNDFSKR